MAGSVSTWAQYTIEHRDRDGLAAHLRSQGVPTAVYYPIPLHRQPAFPEAVTATGELPVTDAASTTVISLPMHPYLDEATQDRIVEAVKSFG
jgi:dTDP-4-amino-4,6-dideoxygalactose transaminase